MDLPQGKYGVILADPAWRFKTYNERGRNRCPDWKPYKGSPARHYETMATKDIAAMPVESLAADNAVLLLWMVWPLLKDALLVIDAWGFNYKTCGFCWVKAHAGLVDLFEDALEPQIGPGYWTRANSEVCLLATRGRPKRLDRGVRQAVIEPRREHSRKPSDIHDRIERLVAGPYLELFARAERPGWTVWGNEVGKFGAAA